ncbi:MAG TPA: sigma-70 family RNA polymerase sigma factor [Opitutus sp.]|nr:sigma-70 family RNA polymerase sigma factor [Opitutus sp.]
MWLQEHRGILLKVARSYARGEAEVAELEQEMLFQLWLSLRGFAGQAKPSTWIYRVCLNTALTWRRGTARRERHFEAGVRLETLAGDERSPAESAEQREKLEQLYAAVQSLAETERALVVLMLDGLSYREIAEVTGLTENHVGVALTRARRRLAERLKGAKA